MYSAKLPRADLLTFNMLLSAADLDPSMVRLLRHSPALSSGKDLMSQWHRRRSAFEEWLAIQSKDRRAHLNARYWASFVGTPTGETIFVGLHEVGLATAVDEPVIFELSGDRMEAGCADHYDLRPCDALAAYAGKLLVEWGGGASGKRAWIQRADSQNKGVKALLEVPFVEPFPGLMAFHKGLADLDDFSESWISPLRHARGVYLMTCPVSGQHYIGSATGSDGFWGRWQDYRRTGHGGNVKLREQDTNAFFVTILEVAGSAASREDIIAIENVWKIKLGSKAYGLNAN